MKVSVLLPTKGRYPQLAQLLPRLKDTALYDDVEYLVVADDDPEGAAVAREAAPWATVLTSRRRLGYWGCCALAQQGASGVLSIALANDLLPSRGWLARGVAAYQKHFGDGPGLLGANDGAQGCWTDQAAGKTYLWLEWASHFLIHRDLLSSFGGWPTWYDHSHGDLELSNRARHLGLFRISPWFVLFHDHWITGGARDAVYDLGEAKAKEDEALYRQRRDTGWPAINR